MSKIAKKFRKLNTHVHGLYLVFQFIHIQVNEAELQYRTNPLDKSGAVSRKEADSFV